MIQLVLPILLVLLASCGKANPEPDDVHEYIPDTDEGSDTIESGDEGDMDAELSRDIASDDAGDIFEDGTDVSDAFDALCDGRCIDAEDVDAEDDVQSDTIADTDTKLDALPDAVTDAEQDITEDAAWDISEDAPADDTADTSDCGTGAEAKRSVVISCFDDQVQVSCWCLLAGYPSENCDKPFVGDTAYISLKHFNDCSPVDELSVEVCYDEAHSTAAHPDSTLIDYENDINCSFITGLGYIWNTSGDDHASFSFYRDTISLSASMKLILADGPARYNTQSCL